VKWRGLGSLSSTTWLTIQTVYSQAFGVAVFAIQAPLLGPRAFGLVAVVMVFVSVAEVLLGDVAVDALLSVHDVEPGHYATMTGAVLFVAAAVGVAIMVFAGPLAAAYHEPDLAGIFRALAVLPLISMLNAAPSAATKRQMLFKPLAIRMIAGVTCGGVAGIVLSVLGMGAWALVWQAIVQRSVNVVVLWMSSDLPFQIRPSRRHWHDIARLAWPLVISRAMGWASSQLPRFILSLSLTVTELGLYSLAARLADIVVQMTLVPRYAVARVELRQHVGNAQALNLAVGKVVHWMSAVCFPLCFVGAALIPPLMHVWLNPKWFAAIVPAQWLLSSVAAYVTFYCAPAILLAANQQRSEALISILQTVTLAGVVTAFGVRDLIVVSMAMALRPFVLIPLVAALVRAKSQVTIKTFLGGQGVAFGAALASGALVSLLLDPTVASMGDFAALIGLGVLGLGVYVLILWILQPTRMRQLLGRAGS
jgi:O-antigen/teichoic acid export membrane protein